jgi:hypothetical protein
MSVRSVNPDTRLCGGVLDQLLVGTQLMIPEEMDPEEIKVDDKFEVEFENMDCWANRVFCKMIRRVEPGEVAV